MSRVITIVCDACGNTNEKNTQQFDTGRFRVDICPPCQTGILRLVLQEVRTLPSISLVRSAVLDEILPKPRTI